MRYTSRAFTLIELLVVVTIIVVLLALLTPALDRAMQQTELTICAARQRGLVTILSSHASSHRNKYPSAALSYEHPIFVSFEFARIVESYAGNNKSPTVVSGNVRVGVVPEMLVDTAFEDFGYSDGDSGRYVIGYGYLGGHPALTGVNGPEFRSPMGLADQGSGELFACLNIWSVGAVPPVAGIRYGPYTIAAHTATGPTGKWEPTSSQSYFDHDTATAGNDPKEYHGALGGNVAHADGSVAWKDIAKMTLWYAGASPGETRDSPNYNPGYW